MSGLQLPGATVNEFNEKTSGEHRYSPNFNPAQSMRPKSTWGVFFTTFYSLNSPMLMYGRDRPSEIGTRFACWSGPGVRGKQSGERHLSIRNPVLELVEGAYVPQRQDARGIDAEDRVGQCTYFAAVARIEEELVRPLPIFARFSQRDMLSSINDGPGARWQLSLFDLKDTRNTRYYQSKRLKLFLSLSVFRKPPKRRRHRVWMRQLYWTS
ncbi:hypothetical protein BD779DRAFT_1470703 [Infundibulicybe gibba]|nr:hypothetical protein BD779DRAFT_1470703 [Infundibulicybe gibba]